MTEPDPPMLSQRSSTWIQLFAAFFLALATALCAYLLLNAQNALSIGVGSFWFLAVLPAFLCALIAYVADPFGLKPNSFYVLIPFLLTGAVIFGAGIFLGEGVVCSIMLAPIWIGFGLLGSLNVRRRNRRRGQRFGHDPNVFKAHFLVVPAVLALMEGSLPPTIDHVEVTRSILVNASADEVWQFALANPSIAPSEGHWTFSQNIVGLPRPRATIMHGQGVGALREAFWGEKIRFDEIITAWRPGRELSWRFHFPDASLRDYTDRHLDPRGPYLKVLGGGYVITPLQDGRTRLTLTTRYAALTHVNPYAEIWGEVFMGDLESNIVTILRDRAEALHAARRAST
jgi:hypothetical protein